MNEFSMYEYLGILKNIKDSINEIKLNLYEFESLIKNNIIDDGNIIDYEEIVNCINKLSLLSSSIEKRNLDRVDRFRKDEIREKIHMFSGDHNNPAYLNKLENDW